MRERKRKREERWVLIIEAFIIRTQKSVLFKINHARKWAHVATTSAFHFFLLRPPKQSLLCIIYSLSLSLPSRFVLVRIKDFSFFLLQ